MKKLMPAVFVGHGSPMNAVQDNDYTKALREFGRGLPRPEAILCVSAHWMTDGLAVTGSSQPEQIYDFYGFPKELYEVAYSPKGSPALARRTADIAGGRLDSGWGIDHGTWSVLTHLYPKCDVPVIQLSLDSGLSPRQHYETGKLLSKLRSENILILGSGNIVHNLYDMHPDQFTEKVEPWAVDFDGYVRAALDSGNDDALVDFTSHPAARAALPTTEHYLPLLYTAALRTKGEKPVYFYAGFQHATMSMRCLAFGA